MSLEDLQVYQQSVTQFLAAAFIHIEREKQDMINAVPRLERREREKLVNAYGEDNAWRGLASKNFLTMADIYDNYRKIGEEEHEL